MSSEGRVYPKHAVAAVGAVVVKDNRVLLVRRKYPPGKGKWSIPGGVVEPGERLEKAAQRELEEETGLRAKPLGIVWVLNNIVRDTEGRVLYHYVILDVLFDPDSLEGVARPGGDVEDVAWFDLEEVLARPDVSRTVKKLVEKLRRSGLSTISIEDTDLETVQA